MEYIREIITPYGAALLLLMFVSTAAMSRIFAILADLRIQATALDELVPHMRAAISAGNVTKAAVAAASDDSCIGRLMEAIFRNPELDARRMRLTYKVNIDAELSTRLSALIALKGLALNALILGIVGAAGGYFFGGPEPAIALKRAVVVGAAGLVVSIYSALFSMILHRREVELNDFLAAEALGLIDTATRSREE